MSIESHGAEQTPGTDRLGEPDKVFAEQWRVLIPQVDFLVTGIARMGEVGGDISDTAR